MKSFMTKHFASALIVVGCAGLIACGDDSSSTSDLLPLDNSFEMVLSKQNYSYNAKDSVIIFKKPECKVSSLDYLVWLQESKEVDSLGAYAKGSTAYIRKPGKKDWVKKAYEGTGFPKGIVVDSSEANESIRYATKFDGLQAKSVFQYDGTCFMKSYYSKMLKGVVAANEADNALTTLYKKFQKNSEAELDSSAMVNDMRAPNCDELTMFDGEVSIKIDHLKESSGKIVLKYGTAEECPITFQIRYANVESDCNDAYEDFKNDDEAEEKFDFNHYSRVDEFSEYCIESLVLLFKKDKGLLKKTSPEFIDSKGVAHAAVDVIFDGLK